MKKLKDILIEGKIQYPVNHQPALEVPKGGSSCKTCKFWDVEHNHCDNKYYRQWAGKKEIPVEPDEYCSDWYEPL